MRYEACPQCSCRYCGIDEWQILPRVASRPKKTLRSRMPFSFRCDVLLHVVVTHADAGDDGTYGTSCCAATL